MPGIDTVQHPPIAILYRDDAMIAVSKPPGLVVHRGKRIGQREAVVLQTLSRRIGSFLYPVHRLDRNTSGVLCFALAAEMGRALQANLAADDAVKEYLALVRGETPQRFISERPLSNHRGERPPAVSEFRRLAAFSRCSLLAVRIRTGRYRQIRRHLNHLAHHVIGDTSHGKGRINQWFRDNYGLPRMFLHAWRLEVAHPRTGERLTLTDPLPNDLRAFLLRLPDVPRDVLNQVSGPYAGQ